MLRRRLYFATFIVSIDEITPLAAERRAGSLLKWRDGQAPTSYALVLTPIKYEAG